MLIHLALPEKRQVLMHQTLNIFIVAALGMHFTTILYLQPCSERTEVETTQVILLLTLLKMCMFTGNGCNQA
jgi:hypothetical protein